MVVNPQGSGQAASRLLPPPSVSGQLDSRGRILLPSNSWQTEEQRAALATYALPEPQVYDLSSIKLKILGIEKFGLAPNSMILGPQDCLLT